MNRFVLSATMLLGVFVLTQGNVLPDSNCSGAATTREMQLCIQSELKKAARDLAETQTLIKGAIEDDAVKALGQADEAWLAYCEANCTAYSALYSGGTGEGVARLNCKVRMTVDRNKELRIMYQEVLPQLNPDR